ACRCRRERSRSCRRPVRSASSPRGLLRGQARPSAPIVGPERTPRRPPHLKRSQMAQRATCSAAFQAANDSPAPACALQPNGPAGQRPAAETAALQVACALQANGPAGQR
ncbi:MAG TPA: hypothetical protein VH599_02630, partial [Ktedonobacterales bacterium]